MGSFIGFLISVAVGGSVLASTIKIINQGDQALVETLGKYSGKKLEPGLNIMIPFIDRIATKETIRERVLDIPPQNCITKDNVSITADAVVYWRIVDLPKAYYKVQNLRDAMVNLVLTQIREQMGNLELDETFTARTKVNEVLLRELDTATDPWGVKVTRVELREIVPSKAVLDSMELQMTAERKKRAAILTSEGEKDAAVNSARGHAEARVLDAEARQKSVLLDAEAAQKALVMKAQAERQQTALNAMATADALKILGDALQDNPKSAEALKFLLTEHYLRMGEKIGESDSSKVMFMDPGTIPATLEGMKAIVGNGEAIAPTA
ncbi:MAG: SPFH/Band 7/PHB domain protein [Synechococcales cyanobacterium RM1_1_8]|nr:SPFH/Band 7/PHB domain protein [Synechococcales cyanobacterium RM1_1_8]